MSQKPGKDRLLPANLKSIQKAVRAAASAGTPVEFRVEGARALVLNVLPSGTATWYVHYDVVTGRQRSRRKHKIGRLDEVSLADAIAEAERLRPAIRKGADPASDRVTERTAMTFSDLVEARFDQGDALRPATEEDYRHVLGRDVLPRLGPLPAKSVTRDHIIAVLDTIAARGSTRRADTARAVISSVFSFGLDRGLVEANPASGLRNRHDNQPRDVVAGPDQIRLLWRSMEEGTAVMSESMKDIVRLALLTGLRRAELAATRREDLDLTSAMPLLTIPRGRAKNRNRHRVPLSPQAAAIFRNAVARAGESLLVFPGERPDASILPRSVSRAMQRTRERLGIADITMHDLRRTAGTFMSQLGVPRDVRGRVLNHGGKRSGNLTDGVYNRYEYDAEKRAALELWADALDSMLGCGPAEIDGYHVRLARVKGAEKVCIV